MPESESEKQPAPEHVLVVAGVNGETLTGHLRKDGTIRVELDPAVQIHPGAGLVSDGIGFASCEARPGKGLGEYRKGKGA